MSYQRPNGHPPGPGYPNGNYARSPAPEPLRQAQPPQMSRAAAFDDEKRRITASCFSKKDEAGSGPVQSYITHIRVEEDGAYPSEPPPPNADPTYKKQRVIIVAVKQSGRVFLHKARENDDRTFQIGKTWPLEELSMIESFSGRVQRSPQDQTRAQIAGEIGFIITIAKPYFWKAKTPKEKFFFVGSVVKIYRKYTNGTLPKLVGFDADEERQLLASSEPPPQQQQQPPPPPQQQSPMPQQRPPPTSPLPPHPSGSRILPGPPPTMPYAQRPPGSDSSLPSQASASRRHRRPSDATVDSSRRSPSAASSGRQRPPSPGRYRNEVPPLQTQHLPGPSPIHTPTSRSITPNLRSAPSQDSHLRSRPSQDQMRSRTPEPPPRIGFQHSRSNLSSPAPPEDRQDHRMPSSRYGSETHDISTAKSPSVYASPHDAYPSATSITSSTAERWRPPGAPVAPVPVGRDRDRPHTPNDSIASNTSGPSRPSFQSERSLGSNLNPAIPERRRPTLEKGSFSSQRETPEAIEEESVPQPLRSKKSNAQEPPTRPKMQETASQLDARIPGAFTPASPAPSAPPSAPPPLQTDFPPGKTRNLSNDLNGQGRKSEESKPAEPVSSAPNTARPTPTPRPSTPENRETKEEPTSPSTPKPGLGPMIGKKLMEGNAASKWKKATQAATVASAFKPRAGGAGARLLASKNKPTDEGPDGVTGVVPAPGFKATPNESINERLDESKQDEPPDVQVTSASPVAKLRTRQPLDDVPTHTRDPSVVTQKAQPTLAYQYEKALAALEIDASILGGQGQEYDAALTEFGWASNILQSKTVDNMEADLRREIARLEAGPWLGQETEDGGHKDAGVEGFEKVLDKAIAECDEMERLLSLYGVELGTLNDDISLIESQASGLQVTTANQKLLQMELQRRIGDSGQGYR